MIEIMERRAAVYESIAKAAPVGSAARKAATVTASETRKAIAVICELKR